MPTEAGNDDLVAQANEVRVAEDSQTVFLDGDVRIRYQGKDINTEHAVVDQRSQSIRTQGRLTLEDADLSLSGESAQLGGASDALDVYNAAFRFPLDRYQAHGTADQVSRKSENLMTLNNTDFSTCAPEDNSWSLRAKRIVLNRETDRGDAYNLTLRVLDVPVLYAPWINFSLTGKRKTGLLAPKISNTSETGLEAHLPFYWNIAPQADATFTPRYMTRRGLQLQTEWRYLSHGFGRWRFGTESLRDRQRNDDSRSLYSLTQNGWYDNGWSSVVRTTRVSDSDYINDLKSGTSLANVTHIERLAELNYRDARWHFNVRTQTFQTLDQNLTAEQKPYQREPQIRLSGLLNRSRAWWQPELSFDSELVRFNRVQSVNGTRLNVRPRVTWPIERSGWFFKPSVMQWYTAYDLTDNAPNSEAQPSRDLTVSSLDTGLFFERNNLLRGTIQTLEPRLYYLNVPRVDQSQLPVFDSSPLDFSFSQLFRENRFSGADRVNDANQLTTALTSREIDRRTGVELWRASIGQISYFDDRTVILPSEEVDTRTESDLVAELDARLSSRLRLSTFLQSDLNNRRTQRSTVKLRYRDDKRRIANLSTRMLNNSYEQVDASFMLPVNERWRVGGRWLYSLRDEQNIEQLMALEYDSCCWALRFQARRYRSTVNVQDYDTAWTLQLVLKGLGNLGSDVDQVLARSIPGYTTPQ